MRAGEEVLSFFAETFRKIMKARPLIGYYEFWVLLTYLSVVSALFGMYFALFGDNIMYAVLCLMLSGVCDTFDGRVASLKKRNQREKNYGMQIDAMADLISFGVFPAVLAYAVGVHYGSWNIWGAVIASVYVLAALIRLAHFNVLELESRDKNERTTYFEGLPTTTTAVLIPVVFSVCNILGADFYAAYNVMLIIVSFLFIVRIRIPKPRGRGMAALWLIGAPVVIGLLIVGNLG